MHEVEETDNLVEFFPESDSDEENYEHIPGYHGQIVISHKKSHGLYIYEYLFDTDIFMLQSCC